jgi:SprT-like family
MQFSQTRKSISTCAFPRAGVRPAWTNALAHEMCHLRQEFTGDRGHHTAAFRRMAQRVCRAHGFDLKTF